MTKETREYLQKRQQRKNDFEKVKQPLFNKLPTGLLLLTVMMVCAKVLFSNIVGVKGAELVQLEADKEKLQHEQVVLNGKIAELTALNKIEKDCREKLAMKPAEKDVVYLSSETFASIK